MRYDSFDAFLRDGQAALAKGPVMVILVEDDVEVESTIRHHLGLGFRQVLVFLPATLSVSPELEKQVQLITYNVHQNRGTATVINGLIKAAPGLWFSYCYNAEYLFFPFCETRTIGELLTFQTEERRDTVLTYVIDLYASDVTRHPNAVDLDDAHFDKIGYFALARPDPENHNHPHERQLDFFGGLRWRFEEFIPATRRRIDRISIFRAQPGLEFVPGHKFNLQEYNTYSCPWHHNVTAAIVSFRTAKALRMNPSSRDRVTNFIWGNSSKFRWSSEQLMRRGLMEPGQWF